MRGKGILLCVLAIIVLTAGRFEAAYMRCEERHYEIVRLLHEQGVLAPHFYYYLALAESTCNDKAVSSSGARSMWQMMPWLIGKRDPTDWREMTRVAGKYITSIQKRLPTPTSHWLVVAAWNTGLHNMQKGCGKVPTEACVRRLYPQAAALADTTSAWAREVSPSSEVNP